MNKATRLLAVTFAVAVLWFTPTSRTAAAEATPCTDICFQHVLLVCYNQNYPNTNICWEYWETCMANCGYPQP